MFSRRFLGVCLLVIGAVGAARAADTPAAGAAGPTYAEALGIGFEGWTYPFTVHERALVNEGQDVRMAYMDVPPSGPANGRTVLLLHGKNFAGFYWGATARLLASVGFRVVIPDQVGFGKSSKPDMHYSFELLEANTLDLLDALGVGRVDIVGHSTGGMLAMRIALDRPERVGRLLLEDPVGLEDYGALVGRQNLDKLYRGQLQLTAAAYRHYVQNYFVHWSESFEHELVEPYVRIMASPEYPRFARSAAETTQMILEQPVIHDLPRLSVPLVIVYGANDRTAPGKDLASPEVARTMGDFPRLARAAADAVPGARVVEVPATGHIPHLEAVPAFDAVLLGFLAP